MKRVLIIYHSFDRRDMGSTRLRRIAKYLPRHGYQPVVLTSALTSRSQEAVPDNIELIRVDSLDLADLYHKLSSQPDSEKKPEPSSINRSIGLTSKINRWLMIPDKEITWKNRAVRKASDYLRKYPVDLFFASLAPRTNLLVARELARKFKRPCVQEFRDLWTGSPYYHLAQPTPVHQWIHSRLERKVIEQATRVTVVCRGLAQYLEGRYGSSLRHPVARHYNFFDPQEYEGLPPPRPPEPGTPFVISYVGAMYVSRNPFVFLEGFRKFIDAQELSPGQVRFRWAGPVTAVPQIDSAVARLDLQGYIDLEGEKSHREALRTLRESDVSLLIQAPGDNVHIPGKLFEAMGAGIPLLAISEPCEVTEIIDQTRCGLYCPHEADAVSSALTSMLARKRRGQPWSFAKEALMQYSADEAVGGLARLFDELVSVSRV